MRYIISMIVKIIKAMMEEWIEFLDAEEKKDILNNK